MKRTLISPSPIFQLSVISIAICAFPFNSIAASPVPQVTPTPKSSVSYDDGIKIDTELTVLRVSVINGKNQPVPNLPQKAFRIYENNILQGVEFFSKSPGGYNVGYIPITAPDKNKSRAIEVSIQLPNTDRTYGKALILSAGSSGEPNQPSVKIIVDDAANESSGNLDTLFTGRIKEVDEANKNKEYSRAIVLLQKLNRDYPERPLVYLLLGQTTADLASQSKTGAFRQDKFNEAAEFLEKALDLDPTDNIASFAWMYLARVNASLGVDTDGIIYCLDRAIELGNVPGGAYQQAVDLKRKLLKP